MLSLLFEGFEAAWLPCSLVLVVPGVAAAFAARDRLVPGMAGFAVAVPLLAWLRFSDRAGDFPVAVSAIALAIAAVLFLVPTALPEAPAAALAGFLTGAAAAELWEPCVGEQFGLLLNELPTTGVGGLARLALYLVGVLAPVGGFIALGRLLPPWLVDRLEGVLSLVGGALLALIAVGTAAGYHDDVVGRLVQWSVA